MEIIAGIFSILFIGLVIAVAFTLGFALLIWIAAIGAVMTVLALLYNAWLRWRFIRGANRPAPPPPNVIEGEYKHISEE